jgi:DNA-binding MarR family transcriptional regulator
LKLEIKKLDIKTKGDEMTHLMTSDQTSFLRLNLEATTRAMIAFETVWIRSLIAAGRSDFGVLRVLSRGGPCPVSEVGRELHLTSGAVTTAIDRVERRGWVTRRRGPGDRRRVTVNLTSAGREVFERTDPELRDRLANWLTRLDTVERAQLASLLGKLNAESGAGRFEKAFTGKRSGSEPGEGPAADLEQGIPDRARDDYL